MTKARAGRTVKVGMKERKDYQPSFKLGDSVPRGSRVGSTGQEPSGKKMKSRSEFVSLEVSNGL